MTLPTRHLLLGLALGALSMAALNVIGPGYVMPALGDEAVGGFDASKLVKFEGKSYQVDYDDSVATTPLKTARVKKIEHGRVSYVDITTTATGTYSSEAMLSPHVKYPGIDVAQISPRPNIRVFSLDNNGGWTSLALTSGQSVTYLRAGANQILRASTGFTCLITPNSSIC